MSTSTRETEFPIDVPDEAPVDHPGRARWGSSRAWPIVAACVGVGALLGAGVGFILGEAPTSSTTVFVSALEASPFSPDPRGQALSNLQTEALVVQSDEVMEAVAAKLGHGLTPEKVAKLTAVAIPPGSQVLTITFTESPVVTAKEGADAVADSYLVVRGERAQQSIEQQRQQIATQELAAQDALGAAAAELAAAPAGTPAASIAQEKLTIASGTLASLASERATISTASTSPGEVLSPGSEPTSGTPLTTIAFGAAVGLLVAWLITRRRAGAVAE